MLLHWNEIKVRNFLLNFLIDLFLLLFPFGYLKLVDKEKNLIKELGLVFQGLKKTFLNALILFLALFFVSFILSTVFTFLNLNDLEKVSEIALELKKSYLLLAYLLIFRIFAEEIFFRGFLVKKTGVIISSILFALAHIGYGSIIQVFGAFILGLILALNFKLNKSLIPNILAHMAYNAVIIFIILKWFNDWNN